MLQPKDGEHYRIANGKAAFDLLNVRFMAESRNSFTAVLHLVHCTTGRVYLHNMWLLRRLPHPMGSDIDYHLFYDYYKNDIFISIQGLRE